MLYTVLIQTELLLHLISFSIKLEPIRAYRSGGLTMILFNDRIVAKESISISLDDRGCYFGDGL